MSNQHILEFLEYFIDLPASPQYAVLLNGAWGVGKSHLVDRFMNEQKSRGKSIVYVSLYGVKAADEIDQLLILEVVPALKSPLGKIGSRVAMTWAKKLSLEDAIKQADLTKHVDVDLIVFDDLERAKLSSVEVLGYINRFVEHEKKKVLIVANEAEVDDARGYGRVKEKVIGMTFDVQQNIAEVLDVFASDLPNEPARKFVQNHKEALLTIFEQAKLSNLRVLKQVMWSWDRFFMAVKPDFRVKAGMLVVFKLFVALCAEVRAGRLVAEDLTDRLTKIVAARHDKTANEQNSRIGAAQSRYPELYLHDGVLSDEVLVQVLCEGRIVAATIDQCLGRSEYFIRPEEEPAWQKVWHGVTRPEEEFEAAFQMMEQQFQKGEFSDPGEVLHVFGLRLWSARMGQLKLTTAEVARQCKDYLDALVAAGRILAGSPIDERGLRLQGAFGMGFNEVEAPEFRELCDYYLAAIAEARKARWPIHAKDLMTLMGTDPQAFYPMVCWTSDGRGNTFAGVPVFAAIPTGEFVDAFLALHPAGQRTVLGALKDRYEHGRLEQELGPERAWIVGVHDMLRARAEGMSPIRRFSITNELDRLISPVVARINKIAA